MKEEEEKKVENKSVRQSKRGRTSGNQQEATTIKKAKKEEELEELPWDVSQDRLNPFPDLSSFFFLNFRISPVDFYFGNVVHLSATLFIFLTMSPMMNVDSQ